MKNYSQIAKYGEMRKKQWRICVVVVMEELMEQTESTNEAVEETTNLPALTAADRCDICGAQAFIRVVLATGDLVFCGHHGTANKDKLKPIAITWQDETDKLN
jgi:hypothetical protein